MSHAKASTRTETPRSTPNPITALAFALLSAVAVGTGYGWTAKPYASELEALRPHAELGQLVEQRMTTMTPAERRQLDALMKWKRAAR